VAAEAVSPTHVVCLDEHNGPCPATAYPAQRILKTTWLLSAVTDVCGVVPAASPPIPVRVGH
jgi:hypothetical protein